MTKDKLISILFDFKNDEIGVTSVLDAVDRYSKALLQQASVSGSLELLQLLLNRELELHSLTLNPSTKESAARKIEAFKMLQEAINDYAANDR